MFPEAATLLVGTAVSIIIAISAYFTYRSIKYRKCIGCGGCGGCSDTKKYPECEHCRKKNE